MRNLLIFLTFLIHLNLSSQTSSEINLGYNFQLQKNKQEQLYLQILDQKVNCLNFSFAHNFNENKLVHPKLFFNINSNNYDLKYKYTENDQSSSSSSSTSQITNNRFRENDLNFQLGFIAKLNFVYPQKIKIRPQVGIILDYFSSYKSNYETDSKKGKNYEYKSAIYRNFSIKEKYFSVKTIVGIQFEKK